MLVSEIKPSRRKARAVRMTPENSSQERSTPTPRPSLLDLIPLIWMKMVIQLQYLGANCQHFKLVNNTAQSQILINLKTILVFFRVGDVVGGEGSSS